MPVFKRNKIKMGCAILVENKERKHGQASHYVAVKLEDYTGKDEFWCLFTEKEFVTMTPVEILDDSFGRMKPGRLYCTHRVGWKQERSFVRIESAEKGLLDTDTDNTCIFSITATKINAARLRAERNPEDVPKQSLIEDMMD